jgi:spoIIIJ-associated protein
MKETAGRDFNRKEEERKSKNQKLSIFLNQGGDMNNESQTDALDTDEVGEEEVEVKEKTPRDPKELLKQLEEEGDIAADYLEGLLDIADLDGDIDIDVENDRASLAIMSPSDSSGGLNHLVGERGQVLDSLQELTRLAVQTSLGARSRLMLDIENFRGGKKDKLTKLAKEVAEEVKSKGEAVKLEPMNAFERKVIHDTIQSLGLTSESEGEEPDRCVVVLPQ